MILDFPILSLLIFLPLLGAGVTLLVRGDNEEGTNQNARWVALLTSGVTLLLTIFMLGHYDRGTAAMQFEEFLPWISALNINYHVGIDGLSVLFVFLTALLTPICILVSWDSINTRVRSYMAAFLALEGFVIGVFCALDFALFYVFWEAMLIPMFLLIGVWGGENRVYAAVKFFLYTFVGSVLMLVAMIYLYGANNGSFNILWMADLQLPLEVQIWLWLALFAAFAVKVPMWPVHTWLPDAHVQAPTAGSVILAGILLKMGGYGFLRFNLPILPEASVYFTPMMMVLSVIAIIWAALVAFAQTDVKKMIAYSSVSHMGFVTLGIFAATENAVQGAILQMLNHGVVSAALFMGIGVVYDRLHTRQLDKFGGIVNRMPVYAFIMMVFVMASVGLPGTNSFVGEFLILLGSYPVQQWATVLACSGIVLGAVYMLWLYRRMVFGEIANDAVKGLKDMTPREVLTFVPLLVLVFWIGLFPSGWLNLTDDSTRALLADYAKSQPKQEALLTDRDYTPVKVEPKKHHDKHHDKGHH